MDPKPLPELAKEQPAQWVDFPAGDPGISVHCVCPGSQPPPAAFMLAPVPGTSKQRWSVFLVLILVTKQRAPARHHHNYLDPLTLSHSSGLIVCGLVGDARTPWSGLGGLMALS